jgi:hypothetical protein
MLINYTTVLNNPPEIRKKPDDPPKEAFSQQQKERFIEVYTTEFFSLLGPEVPPIANIERLYANPIPYDRTDIAVQEELEEGELVEYEHDDIIDYVEEARKDARAAAGPLPYASNASETRSLTSAAVAAFKAQKP